MTGVTALLFACNAALASPVEPVLSTITGDEPAACTPQALATLHQAIVQLAGARAPNDAWNLTLAMVCREGASAHQVVVSHMPANIPDRLEGPTAQPDDVSVVDRQSKQLQDGYAKGGAWGAAAEADEQDVRINFMTGYACWAGFTMHFVPPSWRLASLHGGCD